MHIPSGYTVFIWASVPANYILETSRKLIKITEAALREVGPEKAPAKASWQILTTTLLDNVSDLDSINNV